MLIGLSGKKRSGKDVVADYLVKEYSFVKVSFAEPLKEMLYALNPIVEVDVNFWDHEETEVRVRGLVDELGWEQAKDHYPEIRQLLQRLGTEAGRNVLGENVWVDLAMRRAGELYGDHPGVVIPDMRFVNEFDAVVNAGGYTVRIHRPGLTSTDTHPSETALDRIEGWHFMLDNDGTIQDLHERTDEMLTSIRGRRVNA